MVIVHEQYAVGNILTVGATGAQAGSSGINSLGIEINRIGSLADNGGLRTGSFVAAAMVQDFAAGAGVGSVSRVLTPNSANNILLGYAFSTNIANATASSVTRLRMVLNIAGAGSIAFPSPLNNQFGGSAVWQIVGSTALTALSGQGYFGIAKPGSTEPNVSLTMPLSCACNAASYIITFSTESVQGGTGSGFLSGTSVRLFWLDNPLDKSSLITTPA